MSSQLTSYLHDLQLRSQRNAAEHGFRKSLEILVKHKNLEFTQEPKGHGRNKVDLEVYTKDGLIAFYMETKNVGVSLSDPRIQGQFARYKRTFSKLIITNFLDFEFYRDGALVQACCLGDISGLENSADFELFNLALDNFLIDAIAFTDARKLAKKLAEKTQPLKQAIFEKLSKDDLEIAELQNSNSQTRKPYKLLAYRAEFQKIIENIDNSTFSDLYAQTIAYGLFAARYYASKNNSLTFSRQYASSFIPQSNPLLREFFRSISQDFHELPPAINAQIDSILSILANSSMSEILSSLGNRDVLIHFYETFLEEYDPIKRKEMGVWYTPTEAVDFIVRSTDFILKSIFGIRDGLSSSEKQSYIYKRDIDGHRTEDISELTHRVQILDPATGTGTFLSAVASHIKNQFKLTSLWNDFATHDIVPRLHGFEIMMPSYVMAHMKLSEVLSISGSTTPRYNIFLTNSLAGESKAQPNLPTLSDFVYALTEESLGASRVRHEKPIFVILGNPPYNGNSRNNNAFIQSLMESYALKGSSGALNDDYIKFIRFAQHLVDRNQSGVVSYISNSSFLSSIGMTNMRASLLESFDEIYILNLIGENIFKIKTHVCISFFVKTNKKATGNFGNVYYCDLTGTRDEKLEFLKSSSISNTLFDKIEVFAPEYYFYPKKIP